MKILIIEDERQLADAILALLQKNGYSADVACDGVEGYDLAMTGLYDLILLDVMLPGKDGFAVVREMRKNGAVMPVLMLTAKSEVDDKIAGLDYGADDYLTKPFSTGELLARIRAMTRRKGEYIGEEYAAGTTRLIVGSHEVAVGDERVKLGQKEYEILELLMANPNQIIPKERFLEKIWGYDSDAEYNAIEVYVSFIRKKLSVIGSGLLIKAVRNAGYILEEAS